MNWGSASEFFSMGGYGLYVWGSYGAALLLMTVEPVLARRRRLRALREAASAEVFADPEDSAGR
jgi:heme exporter protein D